MATLWEGGLAGCSRTACQGPRAPHWVPLEECSPFLPQGQKGPWGSLLTCPGGPQSPSLLSRTLASDSPRKSAPAHGPPLSVPFVTPKCGSFPPGTFLGVQAPLLCPHSGSRATSCSLPHSLPGALGEDDRQITRTEDRRGGFWF